VGTEDHTLPPPAIDTHEVVKELKAVGFTDQQAEAMTRALRQSQDSELSNLVTKADYQAGLSVAKTDLRAEMAALRAEMQTDLAAVRAELRIGLAETKSEILKWMVGMIGVQTIIILGAVAALTRFVAQ
jgi:hypothetical protein